MLFRSDVVGGRMMDPENETWITARKWANDADPNPSLEEIMQVPDYRFIYQDQTNTSVRNYWYFDHRIGKMSIVPRRTK